MRQRERGGAVVVVMVVVTAMMAGTAALTAMQSTSTRGVALGRASLAGLYCAEAGLAAVRSTVAANVALWDPSLGVVTEPAWLSGISRDLDGDGAADFTITLRDNDDEDPTDSAHDVDATVFIVSTCIQHPETHTQVTELVTSAGQRKLWLRTE